MLAAVATLAACAVTALLWWRAAHLRAMVAISMRGRRFSHEGVVIGGEGFALRRSGAPAILLLHGAGDTPQTLRYLGSALYAHGFHVEAPLLPGHGRTLREFAQVSAEGFTLAATACYSRLRASHSWVGVVGISMGGALAVQLAAEYPSIEALGLIAPYLAMPRRIEWLAVLSRLWGVVIPAMRSSEGISILDPEERQRSLAYGVFTAAALRALRDTMHLAANALPRVRAPTLMIQSREDNRIRIADAQRAFTLLGAPEKRLEWVTGAAHIITVDFGKENVIASTVAWMETHLPACTPTQRLSQ